MSVGFSSNQWSSCFCSDLKVSHLLDFPFSFPSFLLQVKKHASYMMTVEMSVIGSLCLLASAYKSPDGLAIRNLGFFHGWTPLTWVNILYRHISLGDEIYTWFLNLSP